MFLANEDGEAVYSQKNEDWELTLMKILNS